MKKFLFYITAELEIQKKWQKPLLKAQKSTTTLQVELNFHVEPQELSSFDAIIVGAPTYHHEMPMDFKNLFEEAAVQGISLKGKIGAAFGSYGWSGEAPKTHLGNYEKQV